MFQLESNNLILRQFKEADAESLYELNRDPEVLKYTGDEPFKTILDAKQFILDYDQYKNYNMGRWAVILKKGNRFLGWCGLKRNKDGLIDLGFRFHQKFWGRGYATEASFVSLMYGFNSLNLNKVIGRTSMYNFGAQKVLEKCGFNKILTFEYEGIGTTYLYELTNEKFLS